MWYSFVIIAPVLFVVEEQCEQYIPKIPRVLYKPEANFSRGLMIDDTPDRYFVDFIKASKVWLDRSLLIEYVVNSPHSILVMTAPPRWGKTINLSMLKFFFEIPINEDGDLVPIKMSPAYRYFSHGEIKTDNGTVILNRRPGIGAKRSIIATSLGRSPVIYMNMNRNWVGDNIFHEIKSMISEIFQQHIYVQNLYTKIARHENTTAEQKIQALRNNNTFNKYLRKKERDFLLITESIKFLCQALNEYYSYKSSTVVLVDNYDVFFFQVHFAKNVLTGERRRRIKHMFEYFFMWPFSKTTEVAKVILSGSLGMPSYIFRNDVYTLSSILEGPMRYYYGFTYNEFVDLMKLRGIESSLQESALKFYDGYYGVKENVVIFSPYSVTQFVNKRKIDSYYCNYVGPTYINHFFEFEEFRKFAKALCNNKTYLLLHHLRNDLNFRYFKFDNEINLGEDLEFKSPYKDIMRKYLLMIAYATVIPTTTPLEGQARIVIKIPSNEIREAILSQLLEYPQVSAIKQKQWG